MAAQKGKPGTKSQKQIVTDNQSTLRFYKYMALIATLIGLLNAYFYHDIFSFKQVSLAILSTACYVLGYKFMASMANTMYSETGQLLDSGTDLNMEGGIAEHVKDLIILTAGCQALSALSMYFWFFWLLVPGRAFWLLWVYTLGPYFMQKAPEAPEMSEKKQKKLERRMKRQQNR